MAALRIEIAKLREGDELLALDHMPAFFDLDDEDWTFSGRVDGEVTFHLSGHEVYAKGTLRAHATGKCGRCLDPVPVEIETPFDYVYLPASQEPKEDVFVDHVSEGTIELAYYRGEQIEPLDELRETILLALPDIPHCMPCEARGDDPVHVEVAPTSAEEPEWKKKLRELREA